MRAAGIAWSRAPQWPGIRYPYGYRRTTACCAKPRNGTASHAPPAADPRRREAHAAPAARSRGRGRYHLWRSLLRAAVEPLVGDRAGWTHEREMSDFVRRRTVRMDPLALDIWYEHI